MFSVPSADEMSERISSEDFVDRHNHSNQSASSPDFNESDEGSNYLRSLKGKQKQDAAVRSSNTVDAPNTSPDTSHTETAPPLKFVFAERRKTPRYVCSGKIVMSAEGTNYRMWGTLTDVSLHGCYVEINNTFPVGTKVNMQLDANGCQVKITGVVRATYPSVGMGISFAAPGAKQLAQLQQMIKALAGRKLAYRAFTFCNI